MGASLPARVGLALAVLFALLVGLGWHGYSLPLWHDVLDGSEAHERIAGELRPLRSDDWLMGIPLALSQAHHDPPFPRVNTHVGLGQDLILMDLPIAHWATLFRPFGWGFFLGDDAGVAWMWWSQLLGLAGVVFALALRVAPQRAGLCAAGTLLVVASPFFQFWALLPGRFVVYAGLAMLGALGALEARTPARRVLHGVLLAWSLGCLGLALYPPYQVPLAQLAVVLVGAFAWEQRARLRAAPLPPLATLAAAGLAALAVGAGFALDAGETLERMLSTAYPGERVSTGGDLPLWRLFAHGLLLGAVVEDWSPVLNIAEGASFWLLFPVTGALAVARALRGRPDVPSLALLAYLMLLAAYAAFGLPTPLARATGLSWVPPSRTLIALGLADALLLLRVLALAGDDPRERRLAPLLAGAWALGLAVLTGPARETFPELGAGWIVLACGANALFAAAIAWGRRPAASVALAALLLLATTIDYNPLVRGGTAFLRENPLSRRIAAIDAETRGESLWISYGPPYAANLFRVLGVRAITGAHPVPQLELWRALDPDGGSERIYNRYAHVTARSAGMPGVRFRLASPDAFELIVEPGAPELRRLGVTHALIVAPEPPALPGVTHLGSHAWNHLYAVDGAQPSPGATSR